MKIRIDYCPIFRYSPQEDSYSFPNRCYWDDDVKAHGEFSHFEGGRPRRVFHFLMKTNLPDRELILTFWRQLAVLISDPGVVALRSVAHWHRERTAELTHPRKCLP
ncbi:unnamed protein product [Larinioides sclopetarius]|uniref:Catalase n=1 Tax=Larinioides sclopetarius TaxID=280406 RepID=A0AAV2BQK4_9ARAC